MKNIQMFAGAATSADSPFTILRKTHFPGQRFRKVDLTQAGRKLKNEGEAAALAFLEGKGEKAPYDARPPAKCQIVACSRPPSEWSIAIVSREVQQAVYALRHEDYQLYKAGFTKTDLGRQFILDKLGVDRRDVHVQALNLIIPNAIATYGGVLVKNENHNEKKAKKHQKSAERRREQGLDPDEAPTLKAATDAEGYLLEPPGVNPCIMGYQQVAPRAVVHTRKLAGVPDRFRSYTCDPEAPLKVTDKIDRQSIPLGRPGHIAAWQRPFLRPQKNRRHSTWYSNTNNKPKKGRRPESPERTLAREQARDEGALLVSIKIGPDWLLLDARGLLRNVAYRGLLTESLSLQGLLDMFSGDPTIDPVRGVVTFLYGERVVPIRKCKTTPTKKAPMLLGRLTEIHGIIGMVSVDLGQTNPIAARVSRINADLTAEFVSQLALPDELRLLWACYRSDSDQLEARLKQEAIVSLPEDHQAEIARVNAYCPVAGRQLVAERFGIDPTDLPWDLMTSGTYYVADLFLTDSSRDDDLVHFMNKKKGRLKRTDLNIYRLIRPKACKETRDALADALWKLKKETLDYAKLSQRKRELSRRCANWLVRETRRLTRCDEVVINCEDLNVRFFHGSGKRDVGWNEFFVPKRENRWLIQALHRAFTELAPHQGIPVIEANPARTSITCPRCNLCDRRNRDGETFHCLGCGADMHADFEVATMNLEKVALAGQSLPKPPSEHPSALRKTVPSRKRAKAA